MAQSMRDPTQTIEIESITSPGRILRVDKAKFITTRNALLAVLPTSSPGLTVAEAKARLLPRLPPDLFPNGEKAGWWLKAVQLDQEAKGAIRREQTKPLRFYRLK